MIPLVEFKDVISPNVYNKCENKSKKTWYFLMQESFFYYCTRFDSCLVFPFEFVNFFELKHLIYKNHFFLVRHELSIVADIVIQLYYEEVPNEKLKSPSRLQALMDKVMDQVWKDHTSNKSINLEY